MEHLNQFIQHPYSGIANYQLALEYETNSHYAAAISHFLRCCEYSDLETEKLMVYNSLLHLTVCFKKLGNRRNMERSFMHHAIALCPDQPEAYWLLSLYHEFHREWFESYSAACTGLELMNSGKTLFHGKIGFEGIYMLIFQKAVAAWWIGRFDESRELFWQLPDYPLNIEYMGHVQRNLSTIGNNGYPVLPYVKGKGTLRHTFKGAEKIQRNYSQCYQDLFILTMLDGKKNGFYLEIGSAHPVKNNNTYLLETQFGWKGYSIDINENDVKKFRLVRPNRVMCADATKINFSELLTYIEAPSDIGYLQVDCEPPETTYNILASLPFDKYRFAVVTFEHDYYADATRLYRDMSRIFLFERGYKLVASNIAPDDRCSFEDWWVHPALVDASIVEAMMSDDDTVKNAEKYMLNG